MNFRIIAVALALVLCFGILVGCGKEDGADGESNISVSEYTGSGETLKIPDIEIPVETGTGMSDMDKFYEEQYADMTPEEIAQFEQDLKDLGMTKKQFYSLLYLPESSGETAEPTAEETSAETSAK